MNILLVDTNIQEYDIFVKSCNKDTICITYNNNTTRIEILTKINELISNIKRIGLVFHYLPLYIFLNNEDIFNENNTQFLIEIIKHYNIERIDFLACNTLQNENWKLLYDKIVNSTDVILGASNNNTGNIQYGGDWIMENTSEDIQNIYFNDNIEYYKYLLGITASFISFLLNDTMYVSGDISQGQMGDGTDGNKATNLRSVYNTTGKLIYDIAAENYSVIFLMNDGSIYAVGINTNGQLGLGNVSYVNEMTLIELPSGKVASQIVRGRGATFTFVVMSDGSLYGTGLNSSGQLGLGDTTSRNTLTLIELPIGKTISKMVAGLEHTIILMTDGTLYGAGRNDFGNLGLGNTTSYNVFILLPLPEGKNVSQMVAGYNHTVLLMTDGTIYVAGRNAEGQLGFNDYNNRDSFTLMPNITGKVSSKIDCGAFYTMVLMSDGSIYGTGSNAGNLGTGDLSNKFTLTLMINNTGKTPIDVICSKWYEMRFTFVLMSDQTIYVTGENVYGQFGNGTTTNSLVLTQMLSDSTKIWSKIITSESSTYLLTNDGKAYSCGLKVVGSSYFLGHRNFILMKSNNMTGKTITKLYRGGSFQIALMTDGTLYVTGRNAFGQLGLGDYNFRYYFTLLSLPVGKTILQIDCGYEHTLILMTDGTIYGTGFNYYGQLGLGNFNNVSSLTLIPHNTGKTPYKIYCGVYNTIILMTDGTMYGAGYNDYSQLGFAGTPTIFTEIPNTTGKIPYEITSSYQFIVVLMTDGTIYGMGRNEQGQYGTTNTINYTSLTLMVNTTGKTPLKIYCGFDHTIVLMTDGSLYGTGRNQEGQLGLGDNTYRNTLSLITLPTGKTIEEIYGDTYSTYFYMTDQTVYGTGSNNQGQLGTGDSINKNILTQSIFEKPLPTITNFFIPSKTYGDQPFSISEPTSNSTGKFSYLSLNTNVATISGNIISIVNVGSSLIIASQTETSEYEFDSVSTTLTVIKATPFISNFYIPNKNFGDIAFTIMDPSSNSSGSFNYYSLNNNIATISGNIITLNGFGNSIITAIQQETSTYFSNSISSIISVNKTDASYLKSVGYTAYQLKSGGYTATDLKIADYTASELKSAGYTATELKLGGYTLTELVNAYFTTTQLREAGYTALELKTEISIPPDVITTINGTYSANTTYIVPNYNIYYFRNPITPTPTYSVDASGSFTITLTNNTLIYYMLWGGGGSGGSGNEGGGGGAAGDLVQGSFTLNAGIHTCNYTIGRGGKSVMFGPSNSTYIEGTNGYGYSGGNTSLTINETTYLARGGGPGGPSNNNNNATGFTLGGGSGTRLNINYTISGALGSKYNGGSSRYISNVKGGAGGGASAFENGATSTSTAGARGGKAVVSSSLIEPFKNFSTTKYFCEGGGGASIIRGDVSEASFYGIGGRGCYNVANPATSGYQDTGSGGGGLLYEDGIYSGTGANGGIIITTELIPQYFTATQLKEGGYTAIELKEAGYTATELKTASYLTIELKEAGYIVTEMKIAGYTALELRIAGYTAIELKNEYTINELKIGGYTATEMKIAGYTVTELKEYYTINELRIAGYTATEMKVVGYTASELKIGGYSARELKNTGVYSIIPSGLTSNNYEIKFITGQLNIKKSYLSSNL